MAVLLCRANRKVSLQLRLFQECISSGIDRATAPQGHMGLALGVGSVSACCKSESVGSTHASNRIAHVALERCGDRA
jgi:hypothetical protein